MAGKKPTTRGRKTAADHADARARADAVPAARHDWAPIVESLTDSPVKRAVLLIELASLDEAEQEMRSQLLSGSSTAGRVLVGIKQHRAKILGLYAPTPVSVQPAPKTPDGEVDVLDWVSTETPDSARPPPAPVSRPVADDDDDDDVNAALRAELGADDLH